MIKYIHFLILLLVITLSTKAQQLTGRQLDSLYYSAVKIRRPNLLRNINLPFTADTIHLKSATSLFNEIRINLESFNQKQKSILQSILARPISDTSFISPNNFFRIHYNTSGTEMPTYNLQLFADALDSVYNFEVNIFGYPPPPADNGAGGDNRYDFYIINTGKGIYGYTVPEIEVNPGSRKFTAYTAINNDFTGFPTTGIDAARVTAAHEFTHAIHIGNYVDRISDDEFFYELSATAMEHFVFKTITDYLQYLPTYFNDTQKSLAVNGTIEEFALGIWDIYQKDRFGSGIIVKEWELMDQMRAMDAINKAIQIYGSTFGTELNNFGIWMYYTNYRTIPGQYFEDARFYPLVKPLSRLNYNPGSTIQLESGPLSNSFVTIINPAVSDTLVTIITNYDVQNAIDNTHSSYPFSFILYDHPFNNASKITNNYFINISTSNIFIGLHLKYLIIRLFTLKRVWPDN